jgi:DNA phosphorothioation-associated putative methyltransferase
MHIARHRTAIHRTGLSRPLQLALEAQLVSAATSVLDYGCGHGHDLEFLAGQGIVCTGWDPVHRPEGQRQQCDVVNLGYVINVIEDPEERVQVLRAAWSYARQVLIVAARLDHELARTDQQPCGDGVLTRTQTFQKFYSQGELREWIDGVLQVSCVAAGPGVFFVFREERARQSYLASQYRRRIATPIQRKSDLLFDQHRALLEALMGFVARRGRLPDPVELAEAGPLAAAIGSLPRAFQVVQRVTGAEYWQQIKAERTQDLLVYLALAKIHGRPRWSELATDLQLDVKAFFGAYTRACEAADQLLLSAAKTDTINAACLKSPVGKLTPQALYIHVSALPYLPLPLRLYEACARHYVGAVDGANLIKLHRLKPKVSYLAYPSFDKDPHPALLGALVVPLSDFKVEYWDWSSSENPPILHRKETFVPTDYPHRDLFARLTKAEEKAGFYENPATIGTRNPWLDLVTQKGYQFRGHRLVRKQTGD